MVIRMCRDYLSYYVSPVFAGRDRGQNMIETALIIGVISLVLVGAFLLGGIQAGITDLSNRAACLINGGSYSAGLCT